MLYIFDFDYTLVDTSETIVQVFNNTFIDLGLPTRADLEIKKTIGLPLSDALKALQGIDDEKTYKSFDARFCKNSFNMIKDAKVYLDTVETLYSLKARNHTVAIYSAKPHTAIKKIAKRFGFLRYVDLIVGYDDKIKNVDVQKPNPSGINYLIAKCGYDKQDAVYVGDSMIDYQTAKNAEVKFIGINRDGLSSLDGIKDIKVYKNLNEIF